MECSIPHYIDDPPQFLFWELDETIPVLAGMGFGILVNSLISYALVGLLASRIVAGLKKGQHRNFMIHWLYWQGFPGTSLKGYPASHIRRFME